MWRIAARRHHNAAGEASTSNSLGRLSHRTGDHHRSIHHHDQALSRYRALGDTTRTARTLDHLGHPHAALGNHSRAREAWGEALELYRGLGRDADADRVQRQVDDLDRRCQRSAQVPAASSRRSSRASGTGPGSSAPR
ncbi:tetratricopeptide repeat protein [Saccharothrix xinjiangensis]|uniref:tetratricopeptide repeat protein n=1 Tax=Saccharothrix xinjiangensis TaxID=204798 RepID=UPI0031D19D3C